MAILEKIRRIFDADATYQKRDDANLMSNAPWSGTYDRLQVPKDMHGAVLKPPDAPPEKKT